MKRKIVLVIAGILIAFLFKLSPASANQQTLNFVNGCLPRPPQENVHYRFSLASQINDATNNPTQPFKYLLIRVEDSSLPYIWYSVVGLKANRRCINYSAKPAVDSDVLKLFPKRISSQFQSIITADRMRSWDTYTKNVQRQYPGRSVEELRRMGVFGLD